MAFFSYSPGFEDVLFHRVFKGMDRGFYIEIGAFHPQERSLTYALYRHGFRGVTVEADGSVADQFIHTRPEDTHLVALVGEEHRDQVAFHWWNDQAIRPATASTTREMLRLDDIIGHYASGDIHLLVLRTAQARACLQGLSLATHRPWIIFVSPQPKTDDLTIRNVLAGQGYTEAWFDGLNRFFIAREHEGRLAHYFRYPVNEEDDVVTVRHGKHEALSLALDERDRLAREVAGAHQRRRLAEESASMSLGLRPNWPRRLYLSASAPLPEESAPLPLPNRGSDELAITVTGHFNGSYSLASVNRNYAAALASFGTAHVRIEAIEGGHKAPISHVEGDDKDLILALAAEPPRHARRNVAISQHYPPYVPAGDYDLKLMAFFWEESLIPEGLVDTINEGFDGVLVATQFVAKVLIDSGVHRPVRVVGHPGRFDGFKALRAERLAKGAPTQDEEIVFLHVSSCFPRKGVDRLVEAYLEAFSADDPVRLVIKGFPNPHNEVATTIAAERLRQPNRAPISFINQDMDEERLLALYRRAHAMVLPTRGEGLNLPAAEALLSGLPLIVTAYGGHVDFCASDTAYLLDFDFAPSGSHLATSGSVWVEPHGRALAAALSELARDLRQRPFVPATDEVEAFFDRRRFAHRIEEVIDELTAPWWDDNRPIRMAWVSTYEVRCGIAEYSRHLIKAWQPLAPQISVLADQRRESDLPLPAELEDLQSVWEGDNLASLDATAKALADLAPDVAFIQYHPAYFAWEGIELLIAEAQRQKAVTLVTLHNVRWTTRQVLSFRQSARRALEDVDRIVVHTPLDLNLLKQLGFIDNVVLMPQGVALIDELKASDSVHIGNSPLIGCYGFFLPHKGIYALIEAFSGVRRTMPGARLRLVNAEYPAELSREEIARCKDLAARLELLDAIEWHTEFLAHEVSIGLLSECDVVVLPYEDTNEGSSASVRGALSSRRPVVVTPIQIFEEIGDAVHRVPGTDSASIGKGLLEFLTDEELRRNVLEKATRWLAVNDWRAVAKRYDNMIRGLMKSEKRRPPRSGLSPADQSETPSTN